MKKALSVLLLGALTALAGGKPVGVWQGNSWQRLGEIFYATALNPQWTHDKPVKKVFTAKDRDFDSCSAVIYLHGGGNPLRFREWKKPDVDAAEKFVENGGLLIFLADGAQNPGTKNGAFTKLLGAKKMGEVKGQVEIKADDWKPCGAIPEVFKHMLLGDCKRAALVELTTAKTLIGNDNCAVVAENRLGKGKVLFINVRLTESFTPYRQPYHQAANACLEQLFPFMKKIHAELMAMSPELSKEKRELWDTVPTGPKMNPKEWKKPEQKPVVSKRKYEKLSGAPLRLIVDGKPNAVIIIQKGQKDFAAALNGVFKKMSGTELPVAGEGAVTESGGKWKFKDQTYDHKIVFTSAPDVDIRAEGSTITLGGSRAAYTFLREALGYRMLWPGDCGEVYKVTKTVEVQPFRLTDGPFFRQRHIRNSLYRKAVVWKGPDGKNYKLACPAVVVEKQEACGFDPREVAALRRGVGKSWWAANRLGGTINGAGGASFYSWQKRFGQSHPEYMALQFNGTRRQRTEHIRICKANPEVIKQAAADARAILSKPKNKNAESYNLSPSDGSYDIFCMCPLCRAWDCSDAPRGTSRVYLGRNRPVFRSVSKTDRVFRFTCEVARELAKTHPKIKVKYLAYAGYKAPPKYYHDAPKNLMVVYVGLQYLNNIGHDRDRNQWDFWASVSSELVLRPNFLGGGGALPLVYAHRMGADLRYCASTGMVGGDFDSLGHQWATLGLNYYVLAQMLWDPSQSVDDIIDDYCKSGFGPAADEMKAYFAHLEKLTDKMAERKAENIEALEDLTNDYHESLFKTFSIVYSDEEMAKLGAMLEKAKEKTAPDSMERKRVEFITAGYVITKSRLDMSKKYRAAKTKGSLKADCAAQWQLWHDTFQKHPFAVSIPSMAVGQYHGVWRHCGWKPAPIK